MCHVLWTVRRASLRATSKAVQDNECPKRSCTHRAIPQSMTIVSSGWLRMWLALALSACAEGYNATGVDKIAQPQPGGGSPDFKGEACERGQSRSCTCPDGTEGMHLCARDPLSPTLGAWMMTCLNCPEPPAPTAPQPTAAGSMAAGPDMQAGVGGSGGRSAAGRGGSSGTGGRGGTSGGAGRGGNTRCACNQDCFPVGVLACCRPNGSCGCTWAPGAYCL